MIRYFIAIVFLCCSSVPLVAQPITLTDATSLINIGKQIDIFEDPRGTLSLQQILTSEYQAQFKNSTQEVPNFGTKQISVWCRIRIKNISHKDWILNVDFPNLHSVLFFQPMNGSYKKETTGRALPFGRRSIKNRSFLFPLNIQPGQESVYYVRIENHICIFPLYIGNMAAIAEKQYPEDTLFGIFYGISFIIAFYALALFIAARELYYLYFFVQVIFFILYVLIYTGEASQWLPAFALPVIDYGTVIMSIGIIFVYLFFNAVLNSKKTMPAASRMFLISAVITAIAAILYFAGFRPIAAKINMVVSAAVFLAALILCFYLQREKILMLIFIGFTVGFVVLIFWILMLQNLIPYTRFVNNLFMLQIMWWMIIFSIALGLNINNYIKEKYKAQKESLAYLEQNEKLILRQNEMLEQKVEERTRELKATQAQLIQSEKMASLGELTAGIAHEIQNPLNFVNNFSEVNKELLMEMKEEIDKGNIDGVKLIATDLIDNGEKINHHGRRADAIVKGMLQHSRIHAGRKEATNINALADEYLRLSYHGMRAKDKTFDATIPIAIGTDFDNDIGKINIVPQDIRRVLLNLYNNAFYAVAEKMKLKNGEYEPMISVSTKKINDRVEIRVKDNGNGIPQKVIDKIFQPFFTTKPTGHGTGLGLSLSYDIVKAHGGEIRVESKEGEGSEFVIILP